MTVPLRQIVGCLLAVALLSLTTGCNDPETAPEVLHPVDDVDEGLTVCRNIEALTVGMAATSADLRHGYFRPALPYFKDSLDTMRATFNDTDGISRAPDEIVVAVSSALVAAQAVYDYAKAHEKTTYNTNVVRGHLAELGNGLNTVFDGCSDVRRPVPDPADTKAACAAAKTARFPLLTATAGIKRGRFDTFAAKHRQALQPYQRIYQDAVAAGADEDVTSGLRGLLIAGIRLDILVDRLTDEPSVNTHELRDRTAAQGKQFLALAVACTP